MKKVINVFGESFLDAVFIVLSVLRIAFELAFLLFWYITYALMLSIAIPFHIYEREVYMARYNDVFYNFPRQAKRTLVIWLYSALSFSSFILIAATGMLPLWTLFIITALQVGVYIYYASLLSSFGVGYCPLFISDEMDFSARRGLEKTHEKILEYRANKNSK